MAAALPAGASPATPLDGAAASNDHDAHELEVTLSGDRPATDDDDDGISIDPPPSTLFANPPSPPMPPVPVPFPVMPHSVTLPRLAPPDPTTGARTFAPPKLPPGSGSIHRRSSLRSLDGTLVDAVAVNGPASAGSAPVAEDMTPHLFWVPAHQHPEIAPLAFKEWLERHDMQLTNNAVARVRRRKSYRESVNVVSMTEDEKGHARVIVSPVDDSLTADPDQINASDVVELRDGSPDDPPETGDPTSRPGTTSLRRSRLKRSLRARPRRPHSVEDPDPNAPSSQQQGVPVRRQRSQRRQGTGAGSDRPDGSTTAPSELDSGVLDSVSAQVSLPVTTPKAAVVPAPPTPAGARMSTFDPTLLPLPPMIPPVLDLVTPQPDLATTGLATPTGAFVIPPERTTSLKSRARVRPNSIATAPPSFDSPSRAHQLAPRGASSVVHSNDTTPPSLPTLLPYGTNASSPLSSPDGDAPIFVSPKRTSSLFAHGLAALHQKHQQDIAGSTEHHHADGHDPTQWPPRSTSHPVHIPNRVDSFGGMRLPLSPPHLPLEMPPSPSDIPAQLGRSPETIKAPLPEQQHKDEDVALDAPPAAVTSPLSPDVTAGPLPAPIEEGATARPVGSPDSPSKHDPFHAFKPVEPLPPLLPPRSETAVESPVQSPSQAPADPVVAPLPPALDMSVIAAGRDRSNSTISVESDGDDMSDSGPITISVPPSASTPSATSPAVSPAAQTPTKKKKKKLFGFSRRRSDPDDGSMPHTMSAPDLILSSPSLENSPLATASPATKHKKSSSWGWLFSSSSSSSNGNGGSAGGGKNRQITPSQAAAVAATLDSDPSPSKKKSERSFVASLFRGSSSTGPTANGKKGDSPSTSARSSLDVPGSTAASTAASTSGSSTPKRYTNNQRRYPIHIERAICRIAHQKLANPRRPLHHQVLISNMLVWYMSLRKAEEEMQFQQQQQLSGSDSEGALSNDDGGPRATVWKGGRFRSNLHPGGGGGRKRRGHRSKHRPGEIVVPAPSYTVGGAYDDGYSSDGRRRAGGADGKAKRRRRRNRRHGRPSDDSDSDDSDEDDDDDSDDSDDWDRDAESTGDDDEDDDEAAENGVDIDDPARRNHNKRVPRPPRTVTAGGRSRSRSSSRARAAAAAAAAGGGPPALRAPSSLVPVGAKLAATPTSPAATVTASGGVETIAVPPSATSTRRSPTPSLKQVATEDDPDDEDDDVPLGLFMQKKPGTTAAAAAAAGVAS
ncbi:hypothetical protein GGF32_004717 [Allomyces javanicus]|nr:hypothetical protein GGF32_004717 [Allomyces javanicus]